MPSIVSLHVQPGVITLDTTLTLDRSLSPFSVYNVQVAAYNQYTVSRQDFMYNSTTGIVAFYGILVDVMTTEGGKGKTSGTYGGVDWFQMMLPLQCPALLLI